MKKRYDLIDEVFNNPSKLTKILQSGIDAALLKHKKLGNPVCEWRDGKVVWIPADKIPIK